jgi:hypothetical protein
VRRFALSREKSPFLASKHDAAADTAIAARGGYLLARFDDNPAFLDPRA